MSPTALKRRLRIVVAAAVLGLAVLMVALFEKPAIINALSPGDTVQAEFPRDYKLEVDNSDVKMAGTPIGKVSDVERTERGTTMVTLKVDSGIREKLGSAPSASIRPTTVLGGKYYVDLKQGGMQGEYTGEVIPVGHTHTPVELDTLLRALPPPVQQSMRGTVAKFDKTLGASQDSLRDVLRNAPGTLAPASSVLDAARGTRPGRDLSNLVTDLDSAANVLTRRNGQLADTVDKFQGTTGPLGAQAQPLADAIGNLPSSLRALRSGARDLKGTLAKLETTAGSARPAVAELDPLLEKLDPVLADTRPLLTDLRSVLDDAQPMVRDLVPATRQGTNVLGDIKGPVMDRVNGPIARTVLNEWHGKAPKYPNGGGNGHKFYEEVGYMFTVMDQMTEHQDPSGTFLSFQFGVAPNSVVNAPAGLDTLLEGLSKLMGPPRDQQTAVDGTGLVPGATPPEAPPTQGLLPGLQRPQPQQPGVPGDTGGAPR